MLYIPGSSNRSQKAWRGTYSTGAVHISHVHTWCQDMHGRLRSEAFGMLLCVCICLSSNERVKLAPAPAHQSDVHLARAGIRHLCIQAHRHRFAPSQNEHKTYRLHIHAQAHLCTRVRMLSCMCSSAHVRAHMHTSVL